MIALAPLASRSPAVSPFLSMQRSRRSFARAMVALFCTIGFGFFNVSTASANADVDKARIAVNEARKALKADDVAAAERALSLAVSLRPMHAGLKLELASVLIHQGKQIDALALLTEAARTGYSSPAFVHERFAPLKTLPGYSTFTALLKRNAAPAGQVKAVPTRLPANVIAEGIGWDASNKRTLVTSVAKGSLFAITDEAALLTPALVAATTPSSERGAGLFGIAIDAKRNLAWVAAAQSNEHDATRAKADSSGRRTGVIAIDLATMQRSASYLAPTDGATRHIGDIAVHPSGQVYATDSRAPVIYRLDEKEGGLREWLRSEEFSSLQGIAFTEDGQSAFVADQAVGVAHIRLGTRELRWLRSPDGWSLLGIDGLVSRGCELIATRNGLNPHAVLRLVPDLANATISRLEVIAANHPQFTDISLGALVDQHTFRIVAQSDWDRVKADGALAPSSQPPVLVDVALPERACARQ